MSNGNSKTPRLGLRRKTLKIAVVPSTRRKSSNEKVSSSNFSCCISFALGSQQHRSRLDRTEQNPTKICSAHRKKSIHKEKILRVPAGSEGSSGYRATPRNVFTPQGGRPIGAGPCRKCSACFAAWARRSQVYVSEICKNRKNEQIYVICTQTKAFVITGDRTTVNSTQ